jgi:hypothetical protein
MLPRSELVVRANQGIAYWRVYADPEWSAVARRRSGPTLPLSRRHTSGGYDGGVMHDAAAVRGGSLVPGSSRVFTSPCTWSADSSD